MATTKKTPAQIVSSALTSVKYYQKMILDASAVLVSPIVAGVKEIGKDGKETLTGGNDSIRVLMEANVRMATENRDSNVGKIFRTVQAHVGSEIGSLETFAHIVFPALKPVAKETK